MRCRKVQKLLPLYEDGGLPPRTAEAIRMHVADCSECQREATELTAALGALRAVPRVRLAPEFRRAVIAAVRRECVRTRQGAHEWVLAWQPALATVAVTACVLLAGVGIWMYGNQTPTLTPVPQDTIAEAPVALTPIVSTEPATVKESAGAAAPQRQTTRPPVLQRPIMVASVPDSMSARAPAPKKPAEDNSAPRVGSAESGSGRTSQSSDVLLDMLPLLIADSCLAEEGFAEPEVVLATAEGSALPVTGRTLAAPDAGTKVTPL